MKGLKIQLIGIAVILFGLTFISWNVISIGLGAVGLLITIVAYFSSDRSEVVCVEKKENE